MPGSVLSGFLHFTPCSHFYGIGAIIVPVLQMRKLKLREKRVLLPGPTVSSWLNQTPDPSLSKPHPEGEGSGLSHVYAVPMRSFGARLQKLF